MRCISALGAWSARLPQPLRVATAAHAAGKRSTAPRSLLRKDTQPMPPPGYVWYWAYGANLSAEVLSRKRSVEPAAAAPAVALAGTQLSFQHRSGFATIQIDETAEGQRTRPAALRDAGAEQPQQGGAIEAAATAAGACRIRQPHGVLYLLTKAQLEVLKRNETGYRLTSLDVVPYDGSDTVNANVFVSQRGLQLRQPVPPTHRYLSLIISGAKFCGLSDSYVQQLLAVPTARPGGLPQEYFDTPSSALASAAAITVLVIALGLIVGRP